MSNLSIASVLEKNRVSSENAMVIALDIDLVDPVTSAYVMTLRIVNYDTDLTIDGHLYTKISFDLSLQDDANEIQNVNLSIQDSIGLVRPYLQTYRGAVGSKVTMMLLTVDPEDRTSLVDFSEIFEVVGSSSPDSDVPWSNSDARPVQLPLQVSLLWVHGNADVLRPVSDWG